MKKRRTVCNSVGAQDRGNGVFLCERKLTKFFNYDTKKPVEVVITDEKPRGLSFYCIRVGSWVGGRLIQYRTSPKGRWFTAPYIILEARELLGLIDSNDGTPGPEMYIWLEQ